MSLQEVYEDAIDWMQRWQKGRDANTAANKNGTMNPAQVISEAQRMNRELDDILKAFKRAGGKTDGA